MRWLRTVVYILLISRVNNTVWKLIQLHTAYLTCFSCYPSIAGWKEIVWIMAAYSVCSTWWSINESILKTVLVLIDCWGLLWGFLVGCFLLFTVPLSCLLQFSFLNSTFMSQYENLFIYDTWKDSMNRVFFFEVFPLQFQLTPLACWYSLAIFGQQSFLYLFHR